MAEDVTEPLNYPQKNSKITVNVEEVLSDILVVSFTLNSKLFQGVLLDSTKKLLPCGIIPPSHIKPPLGTATQVEESEDKLYSASQRFTYFQEKQNAGNGRFSLKRNIRPPARFKNARMTVRLRPRQVLCSKCRGICNENSENVDFSSKKRKGADPIPPDTPTAKLSRGERRLRSAGEISPRPIFPDNYQEQPKKTNHSHYTDGKSKKLCPSLIPTLSRLQPNEISNAVNGKVKIKIVGNYWIKNDKEAENENKPKSLTIFGGTKTEVSDDQDPLSLPVTESDIDKRITEPKFVAAEYSLDLAPIGNSLAKSKNEPILSVDIVKAVESVGIDRIEEQDPLNNEDPLAIIQEEEEEPAGADSGTNAKRVLRKKRSVGSMEDLWDETVFEDKFAEKNGGNLKSRTTPVIKISFGSGTGEGTVLKIPAKVQSYIPLENTEDDKKKEKTKRDASAKAAKKALKKAKKEARRKVLGSASPVRSLGGASPRYPNLSPRYAISCSSPRYTLGGNGSPRHSLVGNSSPAYEVLHTRRHKHKVKHKKRHKEDRKHKETESSNEVISNITDVKEDETIRDQCLKQKLSISLKRLNANAYMRCDSSSSGSKSPSNSDASDDHSDTVPDFPGNPLMVRIPAQTINSCQMSDGRSMAVGDVVWGKIHGFPWWPGKVLSITKSLKDDGLCTTPQAHVAWYGSSTSSLMSCDQLNPFLETFQIRYNKKKRGPYKEAIRQATTEAKRGEGIISPDLYSSPSEVDVVS
ncbi:hypothetical protein RUM43_007553 [Polyplax serrata]|uniref:PWWP domain-containing protein n=1 Tax=Polyplax serrata TaxID=468196 RepID=A0AAN8PCU2_POLSC